VVSTKTLLAIALAILVACGAHLAGKPWWTDWKPFDATDIGFLSFISIRIMLGWFDKVARD
jgi:hypothetical protein